MNRELKFRAWNPKMQRMYLCGPAYRCEQGVLSERQTNNEDGEGLMQYTGLKDKNGKEIYEHDILSVNGVPMIVTWEDMNLQWTVHNPKNPVITRISMNGEVPDMELWYVLDDGYDSFVIGNIYENPELIPKP